MTHATTSNARDVCDALTRATRDDATTRRARDALTRATHATNARDDARTRGTRFAVIARIVATSTFDGRERVTRAIWDGFAAMR